MLIHANKKFKSKMKSKRIFNAVAVLAIALSAGCAGMRNPKQAEEDITLALAKTGHSAPAGFNGANNNAAFRNPDKSDKLTVLGGGLSLDDAIKLALANNHDIKSAHFAKHAADGYIDQALAEAMPSLSLSANAQNNFSADDHNDTYNAGARVTQPLWRGGAVSSGLRYAKYYTASSDYAIKGMMSDTIYSVSEKYYSVLLNQQLAQVYEEAVAVTERMSRSARSRREQGVALEYEILRAEVEVASARADLINASNTLTRAEIMLFDTMGVSQDSAVTLTDKLAYDPEPEAFADEALFFELAALSRPDLARAQAAVFMARENLDVVKSNYRPKLDAFGSANYNNNRAGEWNEEIIVGATASIQLYDGLKKRGKIAVAQAEIAQAEEALKKAQDAARVDVVNALNQLKYAGELYASQSKNIGVAKEALRLIEAGSAQGRNRQVEVLDTRAALTDALGAYHRAVYSHNLAKLGVRAAAGQLE